MWKWVGPKNKTDWIIYSIIQIGMTVVYWLIFGHGLSWIFR